MIWLLLALPMLLLLLLAGLVFGLAWRKARQRGVDRWLGTYLAEAPRRRPPEPASRGCATSSSDGWSSASRSRWCCMGEETR